MSVDILKIITLPDLLRVLRFVSEHTSFEEGESVVSVNADDDLGRRARLKEQDWTFYDEDDNSMRRVQSTYLEYISLHTEVEDGMMEQLVLDMTILSPLRAPHKLSQSK